MRIGDGRLAVALAGAALVAAGSGCVGLDKFRQCEMDNRTLLAEKKQTEQDLADCRDSTDNLQTRITSLEGELETKDRLVENLSAENDRLAGKCDELTQIVDKIAGGKALTTPVVIERALPPALDTALKDLAAQYPDMVTYNAERGTVKWASDLLFPLGSAVVKEGSKESLHKFADIIKSAAATGFDVVVAGHTDNVPVVKSETMKLHPTNWHLSAHRAIAVGDVLQTDGVQPTRIGVMGFGEYRPVAENTTDGGREKNRRVEIFIVRKEDMLASMEQWMQALETMLASLSARD